MVETGSEATPSRIVLADTPDFQIGNLRVLPRRLHLGPDDEGGQILEPRVMQVLVALARANDEVVSRDELIHSCWGGRIVEDNSINRCIHALRRVAKRIDPSPYEIETIPRVGYRMVRCPTTPDGSPPGAEAPLSDGRASLSPPIAEARPRLPARSVSILAILTAILLVGAAIGSRSIWSGKRPTSIAIVDSRGNLASGLATGFGTELFQLAGAGAEFDLSEDPKEAKFVVRVSFRRDSQLGRGDVALVDGQDGNLLWSGSVEVPQHELSYARPQIAAKLANVLPCARESLGAKGLDQPTIKLYLTSCELMEQPPDDHLVGLLRKVTEQAPRFAEGWANLAMAEATIHAQLVEDSDVRMSPELHSAAVSHLNRARDLNPRLGAIYVAESELLPPDHFGQRLSVLEAGIAQNPEYAVLYERLSLALFSVGRITEAIGAARRASALNPASPVNRAALIANLAHAGNLPAARREVAAAERIWPNSPDVLNALFSLELRYGDARRAQAIIDRGQSLFGGPSGGFGGPKIVMRARLDPSPENVENLIHFATVEARRVPEAAALRLQSLGQFGALEQCYQVVDQPGVTKHLAMGTDILFRPHLREFRYDKRFPGLATRLGLMQYWQSSNSWPDFCKDPHLPYDCRQQGKLALAKFTKASS